MGYGVMAYGVNEDVWGTLGCRSEEIVALTEMGAGNLIRFLDEELSAKPANGRPLPDARATLRQMVMGEPLDARAGVAYAYWFERMCEIGEFLPNDAWMPVRLEFFQEVQQGLTRAGVTGVSIRDIFYGRLPISLPPPDDFPIVGYTAAADAPALLARLRAADLTAEPDRYVREAIEQLIGWLQTCADNTLDLVTFYH